MGFDLDILIDEYLDSVGGQPPIRWSERREVWDNDVLHVSDLKACPLQVAKRLRGEPQEARAPQESRKFVLANFQHELIYKALEYGGHLIDKEVPVPLPDGWTGTADAVVNCFFDDKDDAPMRVNVIDSKNPVAGAKKYITSYPKPEDIKQVSTYAAFLVDVYPELEKESEGQVFYMPLGGASMWVPTRFGLTQKEVILTYMKALEDAVREGLPDPLPMGIYKLGWKEYTKKDGTKSYSGDLYYGAADWRCHYCLYSCPNRIKGKHLVRLSGAKGMTTITSEGHRRMDAIEEFLDADVSA